MATHHNRDANGFRKSTPTLRLPEDTVDASVTPRASTKRNISSKPLQTSNLSNLPAPRTASKEHSSPGKIDEILDKLRVNDSRRPSSTEKKPPVITQAHPQLSILDPRQSAIKDETGSKTTSDTSSNRNNNEYSGSDSFTTPASSLDDLAKATSAEMERIKWELEAAKAVINQQKRELEETRSVKHSFDPPPPGNSVVDLGRGEARFNSTHDVFDTNPRPFSNGDWPPHANETSTARLNAVNTTRHSFGNTGGRATHLKIDTNGPYRDIRSPPMDESGISYGINNSNYLDSPRGGHFAQRTFSNATSIGLSPTIPTTSFNDMYSNRPTTSRPFQYGGTYGQATSIEPLSPGLSQAAIGSDLAMQLQLNQNLIGGGRQLHHGMITPSPTTTEFNLGHGVGLVSPYASQSSNHTYVTPLEPMNYRRLLDKSVSCDWKYIVDKIVCNNDQQASIFLQQKLKVGTAEQKFEIVESIINQAYPLMINRFGNFLVQRCFEHGTPDQVIAIADAIHGNVISLSMDPFGCHVVQKAFDSVPENHKADMVRELLRRIPDTVIHRYACHVWQKLFELRWSSEPPQIMAKVNDALQGMWHEVALGETGSLVVQNIFENCVEEEKRPAIEEVIANIDLIAHGQFGNWCIQHLCEHGAPPDKRRVIDHILVNSYSYSIDQYASKVVEKCLKISGIEFLDRYLTVITTSHPDRPRIPLIDIAGDQYGNYLIQWILMNTHQQQREQVAIHIRKHMVSLRGSKFGSRVAMLCCNPASATRPGPGAMVNPFGAPGQPRTQYSRFR